jgi:hypothetical protein
VEGRVRRPELKGIDMSRFMMLYVGPPKPPDASHEGWPAWFAGLGERLVDRGSPLADGIAVRADGSTGAGMVRVNGYGVIEAGDIDEALAQVKDHPYLTADPEYSIEVFPFP